MNRRNMSWIVVALAGAATGVCGAQQQSQPAQVETAPVVEAAAEQERPSVEVVFVLDTTGSMSGLIEAAKQKIWSIASEIATAQPEPIVRMGLVGYRDRGDAYITTMTDLTDDLDAVYADLMGYQAAGGGDGPESVNQALNEAVNTIAWSEAAPNRLRVIYLVGDYPPHMDYEQDVPYRDTCRLAAERGIIINTIQCGTHGDTTPIWQEIARSAEGEFFAIEQSGGVVAVATPYDEPLATLNVELRATMINFGTPVQQAEWADRERRAEGIEIAASNEALADRACYQALKCGDTAVTGGQELVQCVIDGTVDLSTMDRALLPEDLRAMSTDQLIGYVQTQHAARQRVQDQMLDLAAQRNSYIKDELAKLGEGGFDQRVRQSLARLAERCGMKLDE